MVKKEKTFNVEPVDNGCIVRTNTATNVHTGSLSENISKLCESFVKGEMFRINKEKFKVTIIIEDI